MHYLAVNMVPPCRHLQGTKYILLQRYWRDIWCKCPASLHYVYRIKLKLLCVDDTEACFNFNLQEMMLQSIYWTIVYLYHAKCCVNLYRIPYSSDVVPCRGGGLIVLLNTKVRTFPKSLNFPPWNHTDPPPTAPPPPLLLLLQTIGTWFGSLPKSDDTFKSGRDSGRYKCLNELIGDIRLVLYRWCEQDFKRGREGRRGRGRGWVKFKIFPTDSGRGLILPCRARGE